jgi:general secretion pathway protein I
MRHARGFTLLEAIVAMVIFAMGAASLYAWQASNMITIDRMDALSKRDALVRDALAVVTSVNPMKDPNGDRNIGAMRVRWTTQPLTIEVEGVTAVGYPSAYNLRLYDMRVVVTVPHRPILTFHVRQVGYRQVRSTGGV